MPIQIKAFLFMFIACVLIGPVLIPILKKLKFGQMVRDDGPSSHLTKKGTPTMGGLIFLIPLALVAVLAGRDYPALLPMMLVTLGFGAIGFIDDFIKVVLRRSLGLKARYKILGQIVIASAFSVYITYFTDIGTSIYIPFVNAFCDLGWAFIPFAVLVIISATNAVNITDGLDGLAAGITLVITVFFVMAAMVRPADEYVSVFSAAVAGGCLGFLVFNIHPARVFMGDTGSLALGGAVAAMAIMLRLPLLLLIVGGVYVLETLSVIVQVASFRISRKRIFKMAPLHHHFELAGWSESAVVTVFWAATVALSLLGFLSLGYR